MAGGSPRQRLTGAGRARRCRSRMRPASVAVPGAALRREHLLKGSGDVNDKAAAPGRGLLRGERDLLALGVDRHREVLEEVAAQQAIGLPELRVVSDDPER